MEKLNKKDITPEFCQYIVEQSDQLINRLGGLTLQLEKEKDSFKKYFSPENLKDKIWEIIEKSNNADELSGSLIKLTNSLLEGNTLFNLNKDINSLKEKAWRLIEVIDEYCSDEFNFSIMEN